jgi:hypothetical protein
VRRPPPRRTDGTRFPIGRGLTRRVTGSIVSSPGGMAFIGPAPDGPASRPHDPVRELRAIPLTDSRNSFPGRSAAKSIRHGGRRPGEGRYGDTIPNSIPRPTRNACAMIIEYGVRLTHGELDSDRKKVEQSSHYLLLRNGSKSLQGACEFLSPRERNRLKVVSPQGSKVSPPNAEF